MTTVLEPYEKQVQGTMSIKNKLRRAETFLCCVTVLMLTSGFPFLVSLTILEMETGGRLILDINSLLRMTLLNRDSVRRARKR